LDSIGKGRSYADGKEAFAAAQCIACHRFGNEGGSVGPDLTAVSSRFTRKDIVESILEPSKVVSEQYANSNIFLKNGDDVSGRVVEENDHKLVLVTNPLNNTRTEVNKADIQKRELSKVSPMPEGLVSILTRDELLDLIAYIESGGKESSPMFTAK
jgi:putative heme-binding domain-containing protein